jgi:hypothetical protein
LNWSKFRLCDIVDCRSTEKHPCVTTHHNLSSKRAHSSEAYPMDA